MFIEKIDNAIGYAIGYLWALCMEKAQSKALKYLLTAVLVLITIPLTSIFTVLRCCESFVRGYGFLTPIKSMANAEGEIKEAISTLEDMYFKD